MKCRYGFVSNSSSCSFVICGFLVPESEDYGKDARKEVLMRLFGVTNEVVKAEMMKSDYYKDKINDPEEVEEYFNEMFYDYAGRGGDIGIISGEGAPEDGIVVGEIIYHGGSEDYGIDAGEFDLEELMEKVRPLRAKMGCPDAPIKLYTGTKCC